MIHIQNSQKIIFAIRLKINIFDELKILKITRNNKLTIWVSVKILMSALLNVNFANTRMNLM